MFYNKLSTNFLNESIKSDDFDIDRAVKNSLKYIENAYPKGNENGTNNKPVERINTANGNINDQMIIDCENDERSESEESSDEEFYVHKILMPLRKSKTVSTNLSSKVKIPASTSSFWPYRGIENFFYSPPITLPSAAEGKNLFTDQICLKSRISSDCAINSNNDLTVKVHKQDQISKRHESKNMPINYDENENTKDAFELPELLEKRLENFDCWSAPADRFSDDECSTLSDESEAGDVQHKEVEDDNFILHDTPDEFDADDIFVKNNSEIQCGTNLNGVKRIRIRNRKWSSWSAPGRFFEVSSPDPDPDELVGKVGGLTTRLTDDYGGEMVAETEEYENYEYNEENTESDDECFPAITNQKFSEIEVDKMSISSDIIDKNGGEPMDQSGSDEESEVDDLPNITNKGKQHWKMFLVPSTSMVWQKEPVNFGHGMPSSKSDTQLVWHRILNNSKSTTASYIPRSPWNNCSFKDAEPRKTIDDDNEKNANIDGLADSRIISDNFNSNIIKTSGKSRKFSSSTTIYDEGIFRQDKSRTSSSAMEQRSNTLVLPRASTNVAIHRQRPKSLFSTQSPRMGLFYGASCEFPMADHGDQDHNELTNLIRLSKSQVIHPESDIQSPSPSCSSSISSDSELNQSLAQNEGALLKASEDLKNRGSPPLAFEEELSDSEISDLEKKIAFNQEIPEREHEIEVQQSTTDCNIESKFASTSWHSNLNEAASNNLASNEAIESNCHQIYQSQIVEEIGAPFRKDQANTERPRRKLPKIPSEMPLHVCDREENIRGSNSFYDFECVRFDDAYPNYEIYKTYSPFQPNQQLKEISPNENEHSEDMKTPIQANDFLPKERPTDLFYPVTEKEHCRNVNDQIAPQFSELPSPSVPLLSESMLNSPTCCILPPNAFYGRPNASRKDYQLLYGLDDTSINRSIISYWPNGHSYDGFTENFYASPSIDRENDRGKPVDEGKSSSGVSSSSCCTSSSYEGCDKRTNLLDGDKTKPTHRAQFAFIPRHDDELRLDVGDPIFVVEQCRDHWCYGVNLRTQKRGIFPSAHTCEVDLVEEICNDALSTTNVEVAHHKGNDVLTEAINKVCSMYQEREEIVAPQTVLLEVSYHGIHVIDKRKKDFFRCPTFDYFYSLQNIAFCGAHPKQLRYFGFITKHPILPRTDFRFACHVFLSSQSTQPIVEAIGRAFKRGYDQYMAFAHPTEDIFIE